MTSKLPKLAPCIFEPHNAWKSGFLGEDWPMGYISKKEPCSPIFALHTILEMPVKELRAYAELFAIAPDLLAVAQQYLSDLKHPISDDSKMRRIAWVEEVLARNEGFRG